VALKLLFARIELLSKDTLQMAKNHRRGNREVKKPKKAASIDGPVEIAGAPWSTLDKLKVRERDKR